MRWNRSRVALLVLLAGVATVACIRLSFTNLPPETPVLTVISDHGSLSQPCTLAVSTTDPEGDSVAFQTAVSSAGFYYEYLDWTVYVASGRCCTLLLLANYEGSYEVRLRARDTQNDSTNFGAPETLVFASGTNPR